MKNSLVKIVWFGPGLSYFPILAQLETLPILKIQKRLSHILQIIA